jgi:hypothetical protein
MENNQSFIFYGHYDVSEIKKIIVDNKLDWDEFTVRQGACYDMRNTKTIPIIYEEDFFSTSFIPYQTKQFVLFENELQNISNIIRKETGGTGYLLRALLVKLTKKTDIPTHVDTANETFKVSRRIHIPIITNPDCIFTVGKNALNMKEGEIWEMNNDKQEHSVVNNGDEDRIHLIIDWCEKPLLEQGFES